MPTIVRRPTGTETGDLYNELINNQRLPPEYAPELKAITCDTVATLRTVKGDLAGNAGPRCVVLNATATPGDGGVGIFYWHNTIQASDDNGKAYVQVIGSDGNFMTAGAWVRVQPPTGTIIRRTIATGSSTVSAPGTKLARFRLLAGGGGSGGANGSVAASGGGASGGVLEGETTTIPATWLTSIGAGGAAGSSAGSNGGAGGDTTISDGTTTYTAKGGPGGTGSTSGTGPSSVPGGNPPAIATNGIINGSGVPGGPGIALSNSSSNCISGAGGASPYGGPGPSRFGSVGQGPGTAAIGPGSGAGGAVSSGTGQAGALGAAGLIDLAEYT